MLTAMMAKCGTRPTPLKEKTPPRLYARRRRLLSIYVRPSGAAAPDFEHLALVLHRLGGAEDLDAELAVRLADDFHGMLVLHDVAGRRVDGDGAARTGSGPALERVDHLGTILDLAVEFLDCVEDGMHGVPVSYTHLRAHETDSYLVCRLLLEKKKN